MALDSEIVQHLEDEHKAFEQALRELRDQYYRGGIKLRDESEKANQLTRDIVSARMADDKQLLASDEAVSHKLREMKRTELDGIEVLLDQPYFARIVLEERVNGTPREIEYRIGKASNIDCRIIDWRKAPIAKLFYEYQEGEEYFEEIQGREREGVIKVRNKIEAKNGKLKAVHCRLGVFDLVDGSWQQRSSSHQQAAGLSGRMPEILSLITREQYALITREIDDPLLIQGIAGSGKTAVALHRLSWMLEEYKESLAPSQVMVFTRTNALRTYMENTLELLGVPDLALELYSDWCTKSAQRISRRPGLVFEASDHRSRGSVLLKGSLAYLKTIEAYAETQRARLLDYVTEKLGDGVSVPQIMFIVSKLNSPQAPYVSIFSELNETLSELSRDSTSFEFSEELKAEFLSTQKRLENYAQDLAAILRAPEGILTNDDTGVLDWELIDVVFEEYLESLHNGLLHAPDATALLVLYHLKNRTTASPRGPVEPPLHCMIDEVQDYNPLELAAILYGIKLRTSITLAGDVAQEIQSHTRFPGWDQLRNHWGFGSSDSSFVTLSVSHRSTRDVMRLAHHFLKQKAPDGGRRGKPPYYYLCSNENDATIDALKWLQLASERNPLSTTAVICRNESEARYVYSLLKPTFDAQVRVGTKSNFSFEEGIIVTDIAAIKGLEFSNVLIWNPSRDFYPNDRLSAHLLYIATTRTINNLCIVVADRPSPLLPHIHSKLVRGYDQREE